MIPANDARYRNRQTGQLVRRDDAHAHLHDAADMPSPDWRNVDSSNLEAVRYVGAGYSDWLDVRFKNGGHYRYYDVPWSVYWGLLNAPSKGKFHHEFIKGKFAYAKLN